MKELSTRVEYVKGLDIEARANLVKNELPMVFEFCGFMAMEEGGENKAVELYTTGTQFVFGGASLSENRWNAVKACFEKVSEMENIDSIVISKVATDEAIDNMKEIMADFADGPSFMDAFLDYLIIVAVADDDNKEQIEKITELFADFQGDDDEEEEGSEFETDIEELLYRTAENIIIEKIQHLKNAVGIDDFTQNHVIPAMNEKLKGKIGEDDPLTEVLMEDAVSETIDSLIEDNRIYSCVVKHMGGIHSKLVWNKPFTAVDSFTDPLFHSDDLEEWMKEAEDGDEEAMFKIGCAYSDGLYGAEQDEVKSLEWFKKAGDAGHDTAAFNVGIAYQNGNCGAEKVDLEEAFKWYMKSAELGNESATYKVGYFYQEGKGVPCSYVKAYEWYSKAADMGMMQAMQLIEVWDQFKDAKITDQPQDVKDSNTAFNNGWTYRLQDSVEECKRWLNRAAELGNYQAKEMLENM